LEVDMVLARKLAAGVAELTALGLFFGMIWIWAAVMAGPGV
jgi:hypothetical protein